MLLASPISLFSSMITVAFISLWSQALNFAKESEGVELTDVSDDILYQAILVTYGLATYTFLRAKNDDPGYLPPRWRPRDVEAEKILDYCKICQGYKPLRSYHPNASEFCISRMDHYCSFLSNSVGLNNHTYFVAFIVTYWLANSLSIYVTFVFLLSCYQDPGAILQYEDADEIVVTIQFHVAMLSFCFSLMFVCPILTYLLCVQLRNLAQNLTVVETMLVNDAISAGRVVDNPFDIGMLPNICQLFDFMSMDGTNFPVKPGGNELAFLVEARRQKKERDEGVRGKKYKVVKPFSDSDVNCQNVLDTPVHLDNNMKVSPGEEVIVSRKSGAWAYAHKRGKDEFGWIPQQAIVEDEEAKRQQQPARPLNQRRDLKHRHVLQPNKWRGGQGRDEVERHRKNIREYAGAHNNIHDGVGRRGPHHHGHHHNVPIHRVHHAFKHGPGRHDHRARRHHGAGYENMQKNYHPLRKRGNDQDSDDGPRRDNDPRRRDNQFPRRVQDNMRAEHDLGPGRDPEIKHAHQYPGKANRAQRAYGPGHNRGGRRQ